MEKPPTSISKKSNQGCSDLTAIYQPYTKQLKPAATIKTTRVNLETSTACPPLDTKLDISKGTVLFKFDWWFFRVNIKFQKEDEYFTAFVTLDASSTSSGPAQANAHPTVKAVIAELAELQELANLAEEATTDDEFPKRFQTIAQVCFIDIWKQFYTDVFSAGSSTDINELGEIFADFRGLVLGESISLGEERSAKNINIEPPFKRDKQKLPLMRYSEFSGSSDFWWNRYKFLRPLMMTNFGDVNLSEYEFTAAEYAKGRALYLSGLGAQPKPRDETSERIPLYFTLYTRSLGSWSTARLLEHMNRQGTLRLAALYDFQSLSEAAHPIRLAETLVEKAFENSAKSHDVNGSKPEQRPKSNFTLSEFLGSIEFQLRSADKKCLGGIEYRIEKSRYYISKFNQGLTHLGEGEFEDFQPYSNFVSTRLGPAFDYIDMLQARYDRIRANTRVLYAQSSTDQLRELVEAVRDRNTEIEHIQTIADFALFAFLMPYYLGMVMSHIWPVRGHGLPKAWWALLLVIGITVAVARRIQPIRAKRWTLGIGLLVAVLCTIGILTIEPSLFWVGEGEAGVVTSTAILPEPANEADPTENETGNIIS